ncbi:PLP-dependent aminotransferase family protein [Geomicrobium sp. JCM 19039]|uniref:MocR-like pyridoxine biosynthesis transcription factor PdxR n=1 Tax=Geomicrobium sp. JCM 19039 TaxID=1460636 RepID=UPI00045F13E9|nr:PLP-dependent aminotransferase family protein [Geomicrobium sp. JCM 19039]GAK14747.1 predicted transcriptional regulator of pyridoxine metabolism [Geomicrobium sp. JCM 19039]
MDQLWCELDRTSTTPLYEQLYTHIKNEIISGRIAYNSKLPSKRKLATFLKISQNTIETAYEQLHAEGYIAVLPRKGYFVQAFESLEYVAPTSSVAASYPSKKHAHRYTFHPAQIDSRQFPYDKWRKHFRNTMEETNHDLLLLGDGKGERSFREEIASYLYHSRGVACSVDQIVVGAGIEVLVQQLFLLLSDEQTFGIEDPGYQLMPKLLKNYAHKLQPIPVDDKGIRVDDIMESTIDVVCTTPSHHFPYGSVLSINRRKQLLDWARDKSGRYIIEDDYDSEFRYTGKTIPSLQSMDQDGKVIYLGSFSKSLIPSARISYMVMPQPLSDRYEKAFSDYHSTVSRIDQHVLTSFMNTGDFEKHLNRMRKIYRRKLDTVIQLLRPYENTLQIIGEHSGLHIVLVIKNGMTENELVEAAEREHLKVYPLSYYSLTAPEYKHARIVFGFGSLAEHELPDALSSLMKAWNI